MIKRIAKFLGIKDFDRVCYRLVYHPRLHQGEQTGFCYQDVIANRISENFCWIVNEKLEEIDEWGMMKESWVKKIIKFF